MKSIFLKEVNEYIECKKSIVKLTFLDNNRYRSFAFNINSNIEISENNTPIDVDKYTHIIYNPFKITLNERKLLNMLYKNMQSNLDDNDKVLITTIEENIFTLMDELSFKGNFEIIYDETIDINKLFSVMGLSYKEPDIANYLNYIVNYFTVYSALLNIKCFISLGLLALLSEEEQILLEKELFNLDVLLIDVDFMKETNAIKTLKIDSDWCLI